MLLPAERITRLHTLPIKVWVLAPQLVTTDANLDYYYDLEFVLLQKCCELQ